MRQHALDMEYTLNEHGISRKQDGIKGDLVTTREFRTEKDIFDFLNLEYKTPVERKDGYAVTIKGDKTPEEKTPRSKTNSKARNKKRNKKRSKKRNQK